MASSILSGEPSSVVTRAYMPLLFPPAAPIFSAGKPLHCKHDATDVVRAHPPNELDLLWITKIGGRGSAKDTPALYAATRARVETRAAFDASSLAKQFI